MKFKSNISLKPYNTFGINVYAKSFIEINSISELKQICKTNNPEDLFIIGGGSNMLLTKDLDKIVVKINTKGITIIDETDDFVWIEVQAGENWHNFVLWTMNQNYGGLENLSLIPGNAGTTPIQNIGAYGVEIKDTMERCNTIEIKNQLETTFLNTDCKFGYRDSIFKNELKNKFIITSVVFKLTKKKHLIKSSYGAIQSELEKKGIKTPTIQDISDAVITIRKNKLPDPKEIGNSGSFFKNPIVSKAIFNRIQDIYPEIPFYKINNEEYKIPAGWLIEKTGFKGMRYGDAGVHKNQALVLVNYGKAEGIHILKLAQTIQKEVYNLFKIAIETEVNIF